MRIPVPRQLGHFASQASGSTSVMAGFALVPLVAFAGMSVDMSQTYLARTTLQMAVDAAALAGLEQYRATNDVTQAQNTATSVFSGSLPARITGTQLSAIMTPSTATMSVTASGTVQTSLMSVLGPSLGQTTIGASANAMSQTTGLGKNLEVSLMLDVTISMGQSSGTSNLTKLQAMQSAAKSLIATVVQYSQAPYTSRVALAPFSAAVNVGSYFTSITGSAPSGSWTSVVERAGAWNATDDPPGSKTFPSYQAMHSQAQSTSSMIRNLERNRTYNVPAAATIVPLTSNTATLNAAIDAFTADGTTAGHIGTAWAWYLLSPRWSAIWPSQSVPAAYDNATSKIAILMSDFDFNVYYQTGVGDMNAQAAALCTAMKASGVTIYTIGFQVDHTKPYSVSLFNNCASDPAKAIEATTGDDLIATYQTIASTVLASVASPVRLAR